MKKYPLTIGTLQRQVNYALMNKIGISIWDLPDTIDFNDYMWRGITEEEFWNNVKAATEEILNENGFEHELHML